MLKVKKLKHDALLPSKAYPGDLGYDLYSNENKRLMGGEQTKISTGIAVGFPPGWGGFIKDRSSMANKRLITSGGVIDNQYHGEIQVILLNDTYQMIEIKKGDKIAQLVPIPVTDWVVQEITEFDEQSERGTKGFGSSGQ